MSGTKLEMIERLHSLSLKPKAEDGDSEEVPMTMGENVKDKLPIEKEYDALKDSLKAEYPHRSDDEIEGEALERLSEPLPNYLVKSVLRTHDWLYKV